MSVLEKLNPTSGTDGVFGVEKEFSIEPSPECPRCGSSVEPEHEINGVLEAECANEDCLYQEEVSPNGTGANGFVNGLIRKSKRLTWPYTNTISVLLFIGCGAAAWSFSIEYAPVFGVVAAIAFMLLGSPPKICDNCGSEEGVEDHFCGNCGSAALSSPVDLDAEPVWRRVSTPDWLSGGWLSLEFTYSGGSELVDKLIDGRERIWLRILDLGVVAFAVSYLGVAVLYVYVALNAFNGDLALGEATEGASSGFKTGDLLPEITVDFLVQMGEILLFLVVPLAAGVILGTIIHELGHGLALKLHGHDVESYSLSLFLGIIPNYGLTREEINLDANTSLRTAWHVDTAGVTLTLLTSGVVLAAIYLSTGSIFPFYEPVWAAMFINCFAISALLGPVQAIPLGGSDGYWFQCHTLEALAQHYGWGDNGKLATYGSQLTTASMLFLFVLLVL